MRKLNHRGFKQLAKKSGKLSIEISTLPVSITKFQKIESQQKTVECQNAGNEILQTIGFYAHSLYFFFLFIQVQ